MGRTELSAIRIGQNSPAVSRYETQDFELEDLAALYGARLPSEREASSEASVYASDGHGTRDGAAADVTCVSKV